MSRTVAPMDCERLHNDERLRSCERLHNDEPLDNRGRAALQGRVSHLLMRALALVVVFAAISTRPALSQSSPSNEEIPIGRCDVLPVVQVKVAGQDMRFLLDTGATTILNIKAFSAGTSKKIRVDSWQGAAATSALCIFKISHFPS